MFDTGIDQDVGHVVERKGERCEDRKLLPDLAPLQMKQLFHIEPEPCSMG